MISLRTGIISVVAASALALGGGTALAADPPVVGTSACTAQVNNDATVASARITLSAANDDLDKARIAGVSGPIQVAEAAVDKAEAQLSIAIRNATARICTGTATETTTTTPKPSTTTVTPAPGTVVFTDDKDCSDFATQADAQRYFLAHRSAAQPDPDRLDRNGNGIACESESDGGVVVVNQPIRTIVVEPNRTVTTTNVEVDHTDDDGSTVATSAGTVPEGSVDTGAAG